LGFWQFHDHDHVMILGWICWGVHSREDWQLSWMFSTCELSSLL